MDPRCPRKLKEYPQEWCSFAVLRLKALRNTANELSEGDEAKYPGCPWAIAHQLSCYCFFKYASKYLDGRPVSDIEIAYLNSISVEQLKKIERVALDEFKNSNFITEIRDSMESNSILSDVKELEVEHSIII